MLALILSRSQDYWVRIKAWATLHSDGCTGVKDWYIECCWEHDYHFWFAETLDGEPITFAETNTQFRKCIQSKSKLRWFSPMSWWRWAGVTILGRHLWEKRHGQI